MDWVEVRGRSVHVAVAAGLEELGLSSEDQADIEVIQEPEKGFLGIGGQDAIVRIKPKPRRRRRRGGRHRRQPDKKAAEPKSQRKGSQAKPQDRKPTAKAPAPKEEVAVTEVDPGEQAQVVVGFLNGLLEALGLEGTVSSNVDEDIVMVDVEGEQTEALIGPRGSIMQAIHEVSRTVVQRQTKHPVRLRLDIAGYTQRRREALAIYAGRLAEQVKAEGQEIILEPMNSADRKVIHDAIAEVEGVRTYSEGEEPHRSVVVAPQEPTDS